MKYDMIIFDIDGTIWDASEKNTRALNKALKNHKIKVKVDSEKVKGGFGLSLTEFGDYLFDFIEDKELRYQLVREADKIKLDLIEEEGQEAYPDFRETFIKLSHKYKTGIVSNCGPDIIEQLIIKLDLNSYITDFIAASRFKITKAEAFKRIMKNNNSENCIYIGDTENDYNESKNAEIDFIWATFGFGKDVDAKYKFDKYIELPDLIEEIEFRNSKIIH